MLYQIAILIFAAVFFSTIAVYLILRNRLGKESRDVKKRLEGLSSDSAEDADFIYSILRDNKLSKIPMLDRILSKLKISKNLQRLIDQTGVAMNAGTVVLAMLSLGGFLVLSVYYVSHNTPSAFLAGVVGVCLPYLYLLHKRTKRIEQFETLLPDAIDMVTDALKAGFSFEAAMRLVAQEMPDPIAIEFAITFEEQNLGVGFPEALANLRQRVPSYDLDLFITALMIHKQTGGNLAEVLGQTGHTIRERLRFMREVRTKTSHSRLSGYILVFLPMVVIVAVLVLNPDYFMTLIREKTGNYLLGAAVALQILGIWVIRRIVDIKV
jgi:tight adherence protein B